MMLAAPPAALVSMFEPWADFFGDSNLLQTVVLYAHVGALLIGGGTAIAADRATLRMSSDVDRRRHLLEVSQMHRVVITSLVIIAVSGVLMFTADIEAFWASWIYWTKMVLVVLLLANGARMKKTESAASHDTPVSAAHWSTFRGTAITSLVLWLAVTLAGVALINYA
jgi:uncharacterized membrane protein